MPVHCRKLEDGSGYGVFAGRTIQYAQPGLKWEECLGVGKTMSEAWKTYRSWK